MFRPHEHEIGLWLTMLGKMMKTRLRIQKCQSKKLFYASQVNAEWDVEMVGMVGFFNNFGSLK